MESLFLETKFTAGEAGTIEGIAWPFGSPDRVGDLITKGAFASARAPLPMLDGHNQRAVIGVWDSVTETEAGLHVKGRLLIDDVPGAKEMRAKIMAGAVRGLSIGFAAKGATPRPGGGRTIPFVDLAEISLVSVPAHPGARVTTIKGAETEQMTEPTTPAVPEHKAAEPDVAALVTKALEPVTKGLTDRLDKIEAKVNRPNGAETKDEPSVERKAFTAYLRHGKEAGPDELKALTVSSDPQGGFLAPAEMSSEFIRDLVEFSPIRTLATVRTTSAPSVSYPKRTGITNAKWKGETQAQEGSEPSFGQVEIPIREVNTYVDVSNQLLADSGGTAEAEVRLALAEDFGAKEGLAFVSGNGVLEPEGLLTASGIGETINGHATNLSADALVTLMYALPAAYRARGSWLMNGGTLAVIRKLKDGQGNYLWQPSYQAGQPEMILGRPVTEAVDMPDVASGAFPIMFGDFATAYRISDRLALSILVNPYLLATNGMTRIHATRRTGAAVVQAKALRKLKMAAS
ncbi:phage major capsid protein [Ancylobacter sp. WKF20]|uniref:phage major capsid protein n=1 Tax=Ancylobacter sp. WKF20 TaxID=3039801 RepID=UPI0024344CCF|nr:phage major capsid protein [Ancylobacter sp. WKF20]WGD32018.1 phage major capsid protein [Ancylobacter sp. WKF20]